MHHRKTEGFEWLTPCWYAYLTWSVLDPHQLSCREERTAVLPLRNLSTETTSRASVPRNMICILPWKPFSLSRNPDCSFCASITYDRECAFKKQVSSLIVLVSPKKKNQQNIDQNIGTIQLTISKVIWHHHLSISVQRPGRAQVCKSLLCFLKSQKDFQSYEASQLMKVKQNKTIKITLKQLLFPPLSTLTPTPTPPWHYFFFIIVIFLLVFGYYFTDFHPW